MAVICLLLEACSPALPLQSGLNKACLMHFLVYSASHYHLIVYLLSYFPFKL
jgi:hypothetical protein